MVPKLLPTATSNKIFRVTHSPIGEWGEKEFSNNFFSNIGQEVQQQLNKFY